MTSPAPRRPHRRSPHADRTAQQDRLLRADPQQREPRGRPAAAAGARGLAAEVHRLVEDPRSGAAHQGRLPAYGDRGRPGRVGALRPRADGGVPLGHLPRRAEPGPHGRLRQAPGRAGLAGGPGRAPRGPDAADRGAGRHRAGVGRAAAGPRQHGAEHLRPAQPVPGQRRGGPPPLGDGLPAARLLRPRGPRGGRAAAQAQQRRHRRPADPRRLQRGDHRLAPVLHVHLLHRPRREVPARHPQGVGLRPAGPHLRVHAQGGGAPHVRRHHRRAAHGRADRRADEGARHRRHLGARRHPALGDPEVPQLPVLRLHGPLRLRAVHQRRQLLLLRAQGPLAGDPPQGRPRAARGHPRRCATSRTARSRRRPSRPCRR